MAFFYFYDASGTKNGPFSGDALRACALEGRLTPTMTVETEDGRRCAAGAVAGLFAQPVEQPRQDTEGPISVVIENPISLGNSTLPIRVKVVDRVHISKRFSEYILMGIGFSIGAGIVSLVAFAILMIIGALVNGR